MKVLFDVGDSIGRFSGGIACMMLKPKATVIGSFGRIIFFATYFLIMFNVKPTWLFDADWFKLLNTLLFGVTNGYFSTLCAILGP